MDEDRVIYNGVSMHPSWPERIEAAQEVLTYKINGIIYERIRHGKETWNPDDHSDPCTDCGVLVGQFHVPFVCSMEECPRCSGHFVECGCVSEEIKQD